MNPFELPGPQFLLFYLVFGAGVLIMLWMMRRSQESRYDVPSRIEDPYLVAVLRGGPQEAIAVATMSLLDRKLLAVKSGTGSSFLSTAGELIETARHASEDLVSRDIEKTVLRFFRTPADFSAAVTALKVDRSVLQYEEKLEHMDLVPDEERKTNRRNLWLMGALALGVIALIKVIIGLQRQRPVLFLLIEAGLFLLFAWGVANPRRTLGGDQLISNMEALFASLKNRAENIHAGGGTTELVWLGAVFGMGAVPALVFPHKKALKMPQQSSTTSSCGSSGCGSSCGGGCGGGCGGCGG